jgi:hypothetical protein
MHLVERGESFWSVAAEVVERRFGPAAPSGQVALYWVLLLDANAAHLPVPADPNLIYPGMALTLPAGW